MGTPLERREISWTAGLQSLVCDPRGKKGASQAGRPVNAQGFFLPCRFLELLATPDGALFLACLVLKR